MSRKPAPGRRKCLDYYEEATQRILASGVKPEYIEILKQDGLLADDNVTGFHEGRFGRGRIATLHKAIQHVKQTREEVLYVEMDLMNLTGLNAALGHSRANQVYAKVAAVIHSELSGIAAEAVFFRHGGDEMSVFLVGATEQAVRQAFLRVRRGVEGVAREYDVHEIPHPKHPHNPQVKGIDVRFGICKVLARYEDDPTTVFRMADTELERHKRGGRSLPGTDADLWRCLPQARTNRGVLFVIVARPAECPALLDLFGVWLSQSR
jgi:diguanylate cyclase (GGDEF)-like protein